MLLSCIRAELSKKPLKPAEWGKEIKRSQVQVYNRIRNLEGVLVLQNSRGGRGKNSFITVDYEALTKYYLKTILHADRFYKNKKEGRFDVFRENWVTQTEFNTFKLWLELYFKRLAAPDMEREYFQEVFQIIHERNRKAWKENKRSIEDFMKSFTWQLTRFLFNWFVLDSLLGSSSPRRIKKEWKTERINRKKLLLPKMSREELDDVLYHIAVKLYEFMEREEVPPEMDEASMFYPKFSHLKAYSINKL